MVCRDDTLSACSFHLNLPCFLPSFVVFYLIEYREVMLSLMWIAINSVWWVVTESVLQTLEMVLICLIPLFATVRIAAKQQSTKYDACLCFWIVLAVITLMEYITFFTLTQYTVYRLFRLILYVVVHQMGEFSGFPMFIMKSVKPLLDRYQEPIAKYMKIVDRKLGGLAEIATRKARELSVSGMQGVGSQAGGIALNMIGLIRERLSGTSIVSSSGDSSDDAGVSDVTETETEPGAGAPPETKEPVAKKVD